MDFLIVGGGVENFSVNSVECSEDRESNQWCLTTSCIPGHLFVKQSELSAYLRLAG